MPVNYEAVKFINWSIGTNGNSTIRQQYIVL